MSAASDSIVLLIQCADQSGIVAKLSRFVFERGGNITNSNQYSTDSSGGRFFMRLEFYLSNECSRNELVAAFQPLGQSFNADWEFHFSTDRPRMAIAVSKFDHCLVDLLYRWSSGEFRVEIPFIVSNHESARALVERHGIPFVHLPVTEATRAEQETHMIEAISGTSDFLVLARYMQVLSGDFLRRYGKDVINIHHSFLPSFKGANPYRQAFDRGVKLIGATAHYATTDLDEGPIIEQVVGRVTHRDTPETLREQGKSLEQRALAAAIKAHIEHRVIRYKNKTVVFE